ncbi:6332_t:CDS:2 [Diversispora eburnea]|uniref:6332_t:CDS:1 n=1 Tax=Diversispora eburnea TaxID=1213867 RepID=A0A9N9CBA9_9GLOM|nr:6332_t:CDS:2 [Diversispora eburnea]
MSDNITLFCLVEGDSKEDVFKVIAGKNDDIIDLKKKIKEERPIAFSNIDATKIVLWKVNIPINEGTMEIEIFIKDIRDRLKLSNPTKIISEVFTEKLTRSYIHIIIERPSALEKKEGHGVVGKNIIVCIAISFSPFLKCFRFTLIVQDVSVKILDAYNKRPKEMLPKVNELVDFFEKPLPDHLKIPILQHEYDCFLNQSLENPCTSEDLNILFRVSETESAYKFIAKILCAPILNNPPPREGTEDSYVSFWDVNIRFPLEFLISDGISIRNSSYNTSTFSKRPDFGFILNNVCPFRGEEKSLNNNEDPKSELRDKLCWAYDPAPYILGYYAKGPDVTFVAICQPLPDRNIDIVNIVNSNLNQMRGRILNLRRVINLSILIKSLQDMIGWHESPEFQPIYRDKKIIIVWATNVKKTFTDHTESDGRVEKLRNVYDILRIKEVPNVDYLLHAKNETGVVYLGPKGMSVKPKNQKELLEAIVCILEALVVMHDGNNPIFHQDIRWPNVIRLPGASSESSKWILIDWDEADRPPTQPATHLAKGNHAPEVFQKNHLGEVDIWSVGKLITEASEWLIDLSPNIIEFGKEMRSNNRPDARDALEKIRSFMT